MRTQIEVQSLHDKLETFNRRISDSGKYDDDSMAAFNNNSGLLCALKWVLGEDTITVSQ
jgi:hypothetical protein